MLAFNTSFTDVLVTLTFLLIYS